MGKRKHSPTRLSSEKRSCLSWEVSFQGVDKIENVLPIGEEKSPNNDPQNLFSEATVPPRETLSMPDHPTVSADENHENVQLNVWLCELENCYNFTLVADSSASFANSHPRFVHLSSLKLYVDNRIPAAADKSLSNSEDADRKSSGELLIRRAGVVASTYSCYSVLGEDTLYAMETLANGKQIALVVDDGEEILNGQVQCAKCAVSISIYVSPSAMTPPNNAYSYTGRSSRVYKAWAEVMAQLFGFQKLVATKKRLTDGVEEVYSFTSQARRCVDGKSEPMSQVYNDKLSVTLLPRLRGYQQRAVVWMLEHEQQQESGAPVNGPHPLWKKVCCADGNTLFYNPCTGKLSSVQFPAPPDCSGGILADEMGLGKTVEVLACLLCNPYRGEEIVSEAQYVRQALCGQRECAGQGYRTYNPSQRKVQDESFPLGKNCKISAMPISCPPEENAKKASTASSPCVSRKDLTVSNTGATSGQCAERAASSNFAMTATSSEDGAAASSTHWAMAATSTEGTMAITCANDTATATSTDDTMAATSASCTVAAASADCAVVTTSTDCAMAATSTDHTVVTTPMDCTVVASSTADTMVAMRRDCTVIATSTDCVSVATSIDNAATATSVNCAIRATSTNCIMTASSGCEDGGSSVSPQINSALQGRGIVEESVGEKTTGLPVKACVSARSDSGVIDTLVPNSQSMQVDDKGSIASHPHQSEGPCLCNAKLTAGEETVFCVRCRGWQHKTCVEFTDILPETNFICPQCWASREPLPCRTTLIISPSPISGQWMDEIQRHVKPGALRSMEYRGVAAQGYINPSILSTYDIIITTYHVLQTDLAHALLKFGENDRPRRYTRKYIAMPSPLIGLKFWRVCLDEAQMVENTNAKAAMMADKLSAVHRWCVTGTPINRGIDDLYGLLYFLNVWPYCQEFWWKSVVYQPFCNGDKTPLYDLLSRLMWRSAKVDVFHELGIPEQAHLKHWLRFGAVERHYYKRQLGDCSGRLQSLIDRRMIGDVPLKSLDKDTTSKLMHPLLQLRQACCHPHVVRSGYWALTRKDGMTMEAVLDQLIKKARVECTDANRCRLAALNGLAGLHAIRKQWVQAVEVYREVLTLAKEYTDVFQADSMQKIHALHNMSEMLPAASAEGGGRCVYDSNLKKEEQELREHYLVKYTAEVEANSTLLESLRQNMAPFEEHVKNRPSWYLAVLDCLNDRGLTSTLVDAVLQAANDSNTIIGKFRNTSGLKLLLTSYLDKLEDARLNAMEALEDLRWDMSEELVIAAGRCHLNSTSVRLSCEECNVCMCELKLTDYEQELFLKGEFDDDAQQTWKVSELELILKAIHRLAASRLAASSKTATGGSDDVLFEEELLIDGQRHLTLFEHRRKEFKVLRQLWTSLCSRVGALDELRSCVSRLTTVATSNGPAALVILPSEVSDLHKVFARDRVVFEGDLKRAMGQLLYLQNLAKASKLDGEVNKDVCPICTSELGIEWCVWVCGHCFCCRCVDILLGQRVTTKSAVKCPVCRSLSRTEEISLVQVSPSMSTSKEAFPVKGSHSTKVEEVVRLLKTIQHNEPGAKALVFSSWTEVLHLIHLALAQNDIKHVSLANRGSKSVQTVLNTFKQNSNVSVLLLTFQAGANGLNIIEATHVILVEPSLSPAAEQQAIGRVHRIGQTKATTVHRFLVKNTVEERLYNLLSGRSSVNFQSPTKNDGGGDLTVGDLTVLLANRQRLGEDSDDDERDLPASRFDAGIDSDSDYLDSTSPVEDVHWSTYAMSRRLYQ